MKTKKQTQKIKKVNRNYQSMVQDLLRESPYSMYDRRKNEILLKIIKKQIAILVKKNKFLNNFFSKQNINIEEIESIECVPPLPVQMFKYFDFAACNKEEIVKTLKSSGTTRGIQSRIPLNKNTVINQTRALQSILSNYLGKKRRIFLVIDHEGINSFSREFSARTAGVRGLSIYSKKIFYLLKEKEGKLVLNLPVIQNVINKYSDHEIYAFGFTYIIWSIFYQQLLLHNKQSAKKGIRFNFKEIKIFHSGGWKTLESEKVSKETFSLEIAKMFNTTAGEIYDFYGMAEQAGIIFVDCEYGNKHVPNFSQVIIRDIQTLEPCRLGEVGLIEVMSILSDSYYCQALLTEDVGAIIGVDDCPCGRKGRYFRFQSRVEEAEIRGCGDTFKEKIL